MDLLKILLIVFFQLLCISNVALIEFPSLPDAYVVGFEVKTTERLYEGTEYSDSIVDKVSFNYRIVGKKYRIIFDYTNGWEQLVELTNGVKKCIYNRNISKDEKYKHSNTSNYLLSTSQVMAKNDEKMLYNGRTTVRNLLCYHWQRKDGEEIVDYYFRNHTAGLLTPVRIVVVNSSVNNAVYDYFDFRIEKPSFDVFQAPLGVICNPVSNKPRPRLPDVISMSLEFEPNFRRSRTGNMVANAKVYLDIPSKQFRIDHHMRYPDNHTWIGVKEIFDQHFDLHYQIFSNLQCSIYNITKPKNTGNSPHDLFEINRSKKRRTFFVKDAIEHFNRNAESYFYEGQAIVRGMRTDVWIYKSNHPGKNNIFNKIEWYFTTNKTHELSTYEARIEHQVPVQIIGYGGGSEKEAFRLNIYDVSKNILRDSSILTPIRHCLKLHESVYTLTLFLKGLNDDETGALNNQTDLVETILAALENLTAISQSRMAIQLITTWTQIDVYLSIFDHPFLYNMKLENYIPAKKIADKIKDAVLNYDFRISFQDGNNNYTVYFKRSYFDGIDLKYVDTENQNRVALKKCDKEAAVEIVLLVFIFVALIIGVAFGFCMVYCQLRKNGHNLRVMLKSKQRLDEETNGSNDMQSPVEMQEGNTSTSS